MPIRAKLEFKHKKALLLGIIGFLIGLGVVIAIFVLSQQDSVSITRGKVDLPAGKITDLEKQIKDRPILFSNPNSKGKSIYLQQIQTSGSPKWIAFEAQLGECPLPISPILSEKNEDATFVVPKSCEPNTFIKANGCLPEGSTSTVPELIHYRTRIEGSGSNQRLFIELYTPIENFCSN